MYDFNSLGHMFGLGPTMPVWTPTSLILLLAWSLVWKGLALWHAGRRGQPWWFVILLVVNTAGILEIVYLFFVAKLKVGELLVFKK
jgi:methionyl-tRNA synthetase